MLFSRFSPPAPKFFIKHQPPKEEGAWLERSASAESSSRDGGVEEPAEALGAAGDPAQEPADADDSLEAKVDFLVPLPLALPPPACHRKAVLLSTSLFAVTCPESGLGSRASSWTQGFWGGRNKIVLLREAHSDPTDLC